jgi:hypothetical protein
MQAEWTDGTSRGQLQEGMSVRSKDMLGYIPWNLSALDRMKALKPWLLSWKGLGEESLTPEGWFTHGHNHLGSTWGN